MLAQVAVTRRALLRWFAGSARTLPWRSQRDPWRVWVSEIMLQQTRVEAVVEPYARFVATFPTLESLAAAREADVLARWSGLGYYRRARLLHKGAQAVVAIHGGRIPASRDALESIPGIGRYTAGAILSIAFGERAVALDANVVRVLARLCGIANVRERAARGAIQGFASRLVACTRPGDVNEALMDLGSAVCTARITRCGQCPLASVCHARASGTPLDFAAARARKAPREVRLAAAVLADDDRVLFLQRPSGEALLAGLWDLPTVEVRAASGEDPAAALRQMVRERARVDVQLEKSPRSIRHEIVGRRITADVFVGRFACTGRRRLPAGARMLDPRERLEVGMPALPVKILRALAVRERGGPVPGSKPAPGDATTLETQACVPADGFGDGFADRATDRFRAARAPKRSRGARGAA